MAYPWQGQNRAMYTVRYIPSAADPLAPTQYDMGDRISGGNLFWGGFGGAATGAVIGGSIGGGMGLMAGGAIGATVGVAAAGALEWAKMRRNLVRKGMDQAFNKAMETSPWLLQSPRGFTTLAAHTMRQQMMMAMHNSAYSIRSAMGNEAAVLHR